MTIIIEIDRRFTIGIDILRYVIGIRLGFVAIHIIFRRFNIVINKNEQKKG